MKRTKNDFNFWPGIADMMLAFLMAIMLIWFAEKIFFIDKLSSSELDFLTCAGEPSVCNVQKKQLESVVEKDSPKIIYPVDIPPNDDNNQIPPNDPRIITLDEASGYSFDTGSARLSEEFLKTFEKENTLEEIRAKIETGGFNVIEIIGHTDGKNPSGRKSNLDYMLEDAIKNNSIDALAFGSNADLGLMRALSVVFFLKKQNGFEGIKFRAYSAAQLILPDGSLANLSDTASNFARRRIELRFTTLD